VTVSTEVAIQRHIYRGYDDPGLPVGRWFAWVRGTGDVSGGSNRLVVIFHQEGRNIPSLFYNLEYLELVNSVNSSDAVGVFISNLVPLIEGSSLARQLTVSLAANDNDNAAMRPIDLLPRPIPLGQPTLPDVEAHLAFATDNVDGETLDVYCEGYVWTGRASEAPGGQRRPPDAYYG